MICHMALPTIVMRHMVCESLMMYGGWSPEKSRAAQGWTDVWGMESGEKQSCAGVDKPIEQPGLSTLVASRPALPPISWKIVCNDWTGRVRAERQRHTYIQVCVCIYIYIYTHIFTHIHTRADTCQTLRQRARSPDAEQKAKDASRCGKDGQKRKRLLYCGASLRMVS